MTSVVYFVGAGLSKALESAVRIPVMADFVSVMADHLDDDVILFTLASLEVEHAFGFTRPEWIQLAQEIQKHKPGQRPPALREGYREILKTRPAENIEVVLQMAGGERIRFGFAINRFFSKIGWQVNWGPLAGFLKDAFAQPDTSHTFVSFNYDLLLDRAVQHASGGRWTVRRGYVMPFNQYVTPDDVIEHHRQFSDVEPGEINGGAFKMLDCRAVSRTPGLDDTDDIRIVKPHGSLNWLAAFDANYQFDLNRNFCAVMEKDGALAYFEGYDARNLLTVDQEPVGNMGLYIVPPVTHKQDPGGLEEALRPAEYQALMTADEVFVIGWSMPETDTPQVALIREAAYERKKAFSRVVIINKNAPLDYFERVADVLRKPLRECEVRNSGF